MPSTTSRPNPDGYRDGRAFLLTPGYFLAPLRAQQAAEKAVKAVVQHLGGEAWGHSVADLLQELAEGHDVTEDLLDGASELDKSHIPTRDPDARPSGPPRERYTQSEAQRHIDHAERILTFCEDLVADTGSE